MKRRVLLAPIGVVCCVTGRVWAEQPALTVYNQNFGVVRENVRLDLKPGINELRFSDITAHLEPDSVMLRDPTGRRRLQIVEQNYRNDPLSQELLLSLFEGQTIEFEIGGGQIVRGRIVRSAYVPHPAAWRQYGSDYYAAQARLVGGGAGQPIIDVGGHLRFGLPGTPLFPSLSDDTILKPTLHWLLETDAGGPLDAELSYVTGGMSWKADYNVVAPAEGELLDLVGWVTIDNQSGRTFVDARIGLLAGDVSKLQPESMARFYALAGAREAKSPLPPPVTEKAFDEYHLYTLERPTTLRDRETKQVEFIRAAGVESERLYVYDGMKIDRRYWDWDPARLRIDKEYGTQCNPKVWVMREFRNSAANHLGLPLPAGRLRFYRSDEDGQLEFIGESEIDHTPKDETIRVYTGNAFDLVGERRRTRFQINTDQNWLDEVFEIRLRNHKKEAVEIRVVEHLYRWDNWEIREKSLDYSKRDSHTIELRVEVPPDGEKVVTYLVHYTW